MRRLSSRPHALLIAGVSCLLTATPLSAQKTDTVTLRNGNRITGEIKQLYRGKLSYSTDDMGTVEIEWEKIARLTSAHFHEVELTNGLRYFGILLPPAEAGTMVVSLFQVSDTLKLADVVSIFPIEAGFWQRIKGRIDIGFSYKQANNLLELSLSGTANYRVEKWNRKITFNTYFQSQDSATTITRRSIAFTGQRFFGHKWSGLGTISFEENSELSLDLRSSLGGASGLFVKQTNNAIAQVVGGLAVTHEKYTGEEQGQNNLELVLAGELAYFRFHTPKTDISTDLNVFPNLTTLGRVRIEFNFRLSYEILKDFTIGFTLYDSFDSQPPTEGASKNDFGTEVTVGWKYN